MWESLKCANGRSNSRLCPRPVVGVFKYQNSMLPMEFNIAYHRVRIDFMLLEWQVDVSVHGICLNY
jgi:hypothetical protein